MSMSTELTWIGASPQSFATAPDPAREVTSAAGTSAANPFTIGSLPPHPTAQLPHEGLRFGGPRATLSDDHGEHRRGCAYRSREQP